MDELIQKFKKMDGKMKSQLILALMVGIALMVLGKSFSSNTKPQSDTNDISPVAMDERVDSASYSLDTSLSYEMQLEQRLEKALTKVEGVGDVEVIITMSYIGEIDIAKDTISETSHSTEADKSIVSESIQTKNVIINSSGGGNQPLIVKQYEPKIEGIVIIAQGGGDPTVRDALSKAAEALLGVPAHKIYILKMK